MLVETILKTKPYAFSTRNALATFRVIVPRYIWMELLTHKRLARCAASARAMSARRMAEELGNYLPPVFYGQGEGMRAGVRLDDKSQTEAIEIWKKAFAGAQELVDNLVNLGVCKSQANRLFPSSLQIKGILTGTLDAWHKILVLRLSENADPDMRIFAGMIKEQLFGDNDNWKIRRVHQPFSQSDIDTVEECAARIARVSYNNEGQPKKSDAELGRELIEKKHLSPFEHIAVYGEKPEPSAICSKPEDLFDGFGWLPYRCVLEK